MSEKSVQNQIDEINRKLDLILDDISVQKQNREAINDLIDDVSIVGKDAFKYLVADLDNAGIELDSEALRCLSFKLIRNIKSIGMLLETMESFSDLAKDLTPVIKQIGLDGVEKFHEFEQKGYFEIIRQLGLALDRFLSKYNIEDLRKLSDNLTPVMDTLANISDPGLLIKINGAMNAIKEIKPEDIEEYSVWKLLRQINKPEVKKSLGFLMAFLRNISKEK